jgi:hypothetical protein
MDTPRTVRVNEAGSDAANYRDAAEGRRQIVHVHGASPTRALVWTTIGAVVVTLCALGAVVRPDRAWSLGTLAFLPLCVTAGLAPLLLWRRLQWARFEVTRRSLTVHTGPLGAKTTVEAWSARAPLSIVRSSTWGWPLVAFLTWDLYVERDDGRRVLLATLYDEETRAFVTDFLTTAYRDAEPSHARHPFAVRFGPMPENVSIEGDVDAPEAEWQLDVRCPRGSLSWEVFAAVGLSVLAPFMAVLVLVGVAGTIGAVLRRFDLPSALCGTVGMAMLLGVGAAFSFALRDQLRTTILRWRGRVLVDLTPRGADVHTTPWRLRPIPAPETRDAGMIRVEVTPLERNREEAKLEVIHGGRAKRLHAPIGTDEAHYVAKIVQAYEAWRTR